MENDIDVIIDRALTGYADATPLAGLEQRVLTRIGIAKAPRRRFKLWHATLAAGAVSLLVIVMVGRRPVEVLPRIASSVPGFVTEKVDTPLVVHRRKRAPKLKPFPAVTPLTGEERALLALVQYQPAEALQFSESLDIEPIQIQPLAIEEQR